MGDKLSAQLKVALKIYEFTEKKGKKIWINKLVKEFEKTGEPSRNTVISSVQLLRDWGIVKIRYGRTENNRVGTLLYITNEAKPWIEELYRKYKQGRD